MVDATHRSKWTPTAIECYEIGCTCSKCVLYKIMGKNCRMKQTVFALVKKYGKPTTLLERGQSTNQAFY